MNRENCEKCGKKISVFTPRCHLCGAIFPAIEKVVHKYKNMKIIIAPHETSDVNVKNIENYFKENNIQIVRLSRFEKNPSLHFRVLLIDRIGLLANLYALGSVAFIGGGFGPGIHNVLEPAAHGCRLSFGERYKNAHEAIIIKEMGLASVIKDSNDFYEFLQTAFENPQLTKEIGSKTSKYILENRGAKRRTVDVIEKFILD